MADIRKRGHYQWQCRVRKRGWPTQTKTFATRAEAEAWSATLESEMVRGVFLDRTEAENTTLWEVLDRYEREVTSKKKYAVQYASLVRGWKSRPLASRMLATIRAKDLADFRDQRLTEVSSQTVKHEMGLISRLFNHTIREWGMDVPQKSRLDRSAPVILFRPGQSDLFRRRESSSEGLSWVRWRDS